MAQVENRIKSGTNERIEFLAEVDDLVDLAKICVSFANHLGGSIFIGVNHKGKIIGLNPNTELKLTNQVCNYIEGDLAIESVTHSIKHYFIIELKISKSTIPVLVKMTKDLTVYYYRVGSKSIEANKVIKRYLDMRKFGKTVTESVHHFEFLNKIGEQNLSLSSLYKLIGKKPNEVDKITADLLYLNKLKPSFLDEKTCYTKTKS